MEGDHLQVEGIREEAHELVDDAVEGERGTLLLSVQPELVLGVQPGHQTQLHRDLEEDELEDVVVGLALGGVHHLGPLLSPLLQTLHALEQQIVPLHDHLGDAVLFHVGAVGDVDDVEGKAESRVEKQQAVQLGVLDVLEHDLLGALDSEKACVEHAEWGLRDEVNVRVVGVGRVAEGTM